MHERVKMDRTWRRSVHRGPSTVQPRWLDRRQVRSLAGQDAGHFPLQSVHPPAGIHHELYGDFLHKMRDKLVDLTSEESRMLKIPKIEPASDVI